MQQGMAAESRSEVANYHRETSGAESHQIDQMQGWIYTPQWTKKKVMLTKTHLNSHCSKGERLAFLTRHKAVSQARRQVCDKLLSMPK